MKKIIVLLITLLLMGCESNEVVIDIDSETIELSDTGELILELWDEEPAWKDVISVRLGDKEIIVKPSFIEETVDMNAVGEYEVNIRVPDENDYAIIGEKTFVVKVMTKSLYSATDVLLVLGDAAIRKLSGDDVDETVICTNAGTTVFAVACIEMLRTPISDIASELGVNETILSLLVNATSIKLNILSISEDKMTSDEMIDERLDEYDEAYWVEFIFEIDYFFGEYVDSAKALMVLDGEVFRIESFI